MSTQSFLNKLLRIKFSIFVALVVAFALLISAVRIAMYSLPDHRQRIESWLSDDTFEVSIGDLRGQWNYLLPSLDVSNVELRSPSGQKVFELGHLELELDLLESLQRGKAIFQRIVLDRLELQLLRTKEKSWQVQGLTSDAEQGDSVSLEKLIRRLLRHGEIRLVNAIVQVHFEDGPSYPPQVINASLQSQGERVSLQTQLEKVGGKVLDFRLVGRGLPGSDQFKGNFYFKADTMGMRFWRQFLPPEYSQLKQFSFGTQLWGHIDGKLPARISGELELPELLWQDAQGEMSLSQFATKLLVNQREGRWQWQLDDVQGRIGDLSLPFNKLNGSWKSEAPLQISSDWLDIGKTNQLVLANPFIPEAVTKELEILQPKGSLRNLSVAIDPSEGAPKLFQMRADLDDVEVLSWEGAPEIRHVNGLLEVDENGGSVSFDNRDMVLNFPDLYRQGWTLGRAVGRVSWQIFDDAVRVDSGLLTAAMDGVDAHGRFGLYVPFAEDLPSDFTLMIGMDQSNGKLAPLFVPDKVIEPALFDWLSSAIKEGHLKSGGFIYQGPLESWAHTPSIQMHFDVEGGRIKYQPEWPEAYNASAFTMVKNTQVLVDIYGGKVYDTDILSGQVYLPPDSSILEVRSEIKGPASDGRKVLLSAPTKEYLGDEFAQWQLEGKADTTLKLDLDLEDLEKSRIDVSSRVAQGRYFSPDLDLHFSDITGQIRYRDDKGLTAKGLKARFFDKPIRVNVRTENRSDGIHTLLEGTGRVEVAKFNQWLKQPILDMWQGESDYSAKLDICSSNPQCTVLQVNSNLVGITSDGVPEPFAKDAATKRPVEVRMNLTGARNWLRINYGDQFQSLFSLQNEITGGEIVVGRGQNKPRALREGLRIQGTLPVAEPQSWQQFLDRLFPETVSDSGKLEIDPILKSVDLTARQIRFGENSFDDVQASFVPVSDGWQLSLNAPGVKGVVLLPESLSSPYQVDLDRLYLPDDGEDESEADSRSKKVDPLQDFDPATLPSMLLSVADLRLGDDDMGRWKLRVEPVDEGVRIKGIEGLVREMDTKADLWWLNSEVGHRTRVGLDLKAEQLANVQRAWGNEPVLESKDAVLSGNLSWQGSPLNFNVATLSGDMDMKTGQGRFIDADAAGGAIKLFGLLNFKALGRRLRLDFSDLSKKGLSFDKISAAYRIDNGVGQSTKALKMEGPTAGLELSGSFNLNEETLDQRMTVTLPLAENLSLTAVLLGSPQVAGAVFLIEKLVGKQVQKFTSAKYSVTGSWHDPVMEPIKAPPVEESQESPFN